jgi:hypothetical protein
VRRLRPSCPSHAPPLFTRQRVPPPLPQVTDVKTGDCHRADHLLEHALEALLEDAKNPPLAEEAKAARDLLARVGELGAQELGDALSRYGVKAPDTKNDISAPFPFNLMFKCGGLGRATPGLGVSYAWRAAAASRSRVCWARWAQLKTVVHTLSMARRYPRPHPVQDVHRPQGRHGRLPAPRDRPGHLCELQGPALLQRLQAALRRCPDWQ